MSVERYISSTNNAQIQRIVNFYASLIIKNEVEANSTETTQSEANFLDYQSAVQKSDSFINYTDISYDQFTSAGFNSIDTEKYFNNYIGLNNLLYNQDGRALSLINSLRSIRISNYTEGNSYYSIFLGVPPDPSQYVYVTDEDSNPLPNGTLPLVRIDLVNASEYPKTYDRLFVKMAITQIIAQYPTYLYLVFLAAPLNIIYIRNAPQFTILYYNPNILIYDEIDYFFEAYENCRSKMLVIDWIEGYENRFPNYSHTMLLLLLYESFLFFCNSYLIAFSRRNYTDNDIYNILDSNGLSDLKTQDMSLLRNLVEHLPLIMSVRGTDSVINAVLNAIQINDVQVKRYNLTKYFSPSMEFVTQMNYEQGYADQVDLMFVETVEGGSGNVSSTIYPYTSFVANDPYWGGRPNASQEIRAEAQENLRRKLLSMKFSSIKTKYLVVARQVQIMEMTAQVSNYLGLAFQYNENILNILISGNAPYNGIDVQPLSLWAAMCWGTAMMNGLPNPDTIRNDAFEIADVIMLRKTMGISGLAQSILSTDVTIGSISGSVKLGTLFKFQPGDSLINYLVSFNITGSSTLAELFSQYGTNMKIINTVESLIAKSTTREEYIFWKYIQSYNKTSQYISNLFNGETSYQKYIQDNAANFYTQIEVIFTYNLSDPASRATFSTTLANIITSFTNFLSNQTNGICNIPSQRDISNGGDTSLESIQALLSDFVSIYTELYNVEYDELFNDPLENTIHPLFYLNQSLLSMQDGFSMLPKEIKKMDVLSGFMDGAIPWIENIYQSSFSSVSDELIPENDTTRYKEVSSIVELINQENVDIGEKILPSSLEVRKDKAIMNDIAIWT